MMGALREACCQLEEVLKVTCDRCHLTLDRLNAVENYMTDCMAIELSLQLGMASQCVHTCSQQLASLHGDTGTITIFMDGAGGVAMHWVHDPRLVANRAEWASKGLTVLSVDEMSQAIGRKIIDAWSGNWLPVLEWLRKYGRDFGLDGAGNERLLRWP